MKGVDPFLIVVFLGTLSGGAFGFVSSGAYSSLRSMDKEDNIYWFIILRGAMTIVLLVLSFFYVYTYTEFTDSWSTKLIASFQHGLLSVQLTALPNEDDSEYQNVYSIAPLVFLILTGIVLETFPQVFIVGCFGGFLMELIWWSKRIRKKRKPSVPKYYWIVAPLLILSAGGITCLYGTQIQGIFAVTSGAGVSGFFKNLT